MHMCRLHTARLRQGSAPTWTDLQTRQGWAEWQWQRGRTPLGAPALKKLLDAPLRALRGIPPSVPQQHPRSAPTLLMHSRPERSRHGHAQLLAARLQRRLARRHILPKRDGAPGVQARGAEQQNARGRLCQLPTHLHMQRRHNGSDAAGGGQLRMHAGVAAVHSTPRVQCAKPPHRAPRSRYRPSCKLTARGAATPRAGTTNFGSRWGTRCLGSAELATTLWWHSVAAAARRKRCTCGSGAAEASMTLTCRQEADAGLGNQQREAAYRNWPRLLLPAQPCLHCIKPYLT